MLSSLSLIITTLVFFGCLYGMIELVKRSKRVRTFTKMPLAYYLSLGIIGSAWTYYSFIGLSREFGINSFSYFLGISTMFLAAPLLLQPLLEICRKHQLNSLPDLMSFRFRSPFAGSVTGALLIITVLPFYAVQLHSVADANSLLSNITDQSQYIFVSLFALLCTLLTLNIIGERVRGAQRHQNLIAIIGLSTLIKLAAAMTLGLVAIYGIFGDFSAMQQWLAQHPSVLNNFYTPDTTAPQRVMLLIFFASIIGMPHIFHMIFAGSPSARNFENARWGVPLLLLIMALPIIPMMWASYASPLELPNDYLILNIAYIVDSPFLAIITHIGGLAAACGIVIILNLALSTILINHVILPMTPLDPTQNIYGQLVKIRRAVIIGLAVIGLAIHMLLNESNQILPFAMLSFSASLQFLPGCIALIYWRGATRNGYISGVIAGFFVWCIFIAFPESILHILNQSENVVHLSFETKANIWSISAAISLIINIVFLLLVSWLSDVRREDREGAIACVLNAPQLGSSRHYTLNTPEEITQRLAPFLGDTAAKNEVSKSVLTLNLPWSTLDDDQTNDLVNNIESNLYELLGPAIAHHTMNSAFPESHTNDSEIVYLEDKLETYQSKLHGVADELKSVRQHYQQILLGLPVGALTFTKQGIIISWNTAMTDITGIDVGAALNNNLKNLTPPWGNIFTAYIASNTAQHNRLDVKTDKGVQWLNIHTSVGSKNNESFILVEDITETQLLEHELIHSERLASIGRLAAGVAHEIGNPVTGIACLAQNLEYDKDNTQAVTDTAEEIINQTKRINTIIRSLMNFAHGETYAGNIDEHAQANVVHCCDEAIKLLQLNKDKTEVIFQNLTDCQSRVNIDEQRLIQLFINLLENARDASKAGDIINVRCAINGSMLDIYVEDHGAGIPNDHLEKIFEPFFTTKDAGSGTGLGLALVYSIIEQHNGNISVTSPLIGQNFGTEFKISLPIS
jgi:signal transduction histidine kinase/Na+/proline symporter